MFTILIIGRSQFFKKHFEVDKIEVGRALDNDLVLPDLSVSRRHCRIYAARLEFQIEDRGSANGCHVNGLPIAGHSLVLPHDEIQIGTYTLYIQPGLASMGSYFARSAFSKERGAPSLASPRAARSPDAATGRLHRRGESGAQAVPTRASLRRMIACILCDDAELDAFCLDHFPHIRARFASSMDRISKVTQLLERALPDEILRCLHEAYPEEVEQNQRLLCFTDP
ncbi:MAG: FHA domain-containing protein [Polyangia bacterium]